MTIYTVCIDRENGTMLAFDPDNPEDFQVQSTKEQACFALIDSILKKNNAAHVHSVFEFTDEMLFRGR